MKFLFVSSSLFKLLRKLRALLWYIKDLYCVLDNTDFVVKGFEYNSLWKDKLYIVLWVIQIDAKLELWKTKSNTTSPYLNLLSFDLFIAAIHPGAYETLWSASLDVKSIVAGSWFYGGVFFLYIK